MVDKVNGQPREDIWFERDVSLLSLVSDAADFEDPADFAVDGMVELVVRVLQTRGTVIGLSREDDNTLHIMMGHAAGAFVVDPLGRDVIAQLEAELSAIPSSGNFTLTLGSKFQVV